MRRAVIDLGTNTFNLLIADLGETGFQQVYSGRKAVLLGMGGINQGIIAEDAIARAMDAINEFKQVCDRHGVSYIACFGTSALRSAKNADELVSAARASFGVDIRIISGMKEAELIYEGTKFAHDFTEDTVIMDIGGGSTEFIHADGNGVKTMTSLDIGVSRIYQQLGKPKEYTSEDIQVTRRFFEQGSDQFFGSKKIGTMIGASGSFETFFQMFCGRDFMDETRAIELPFNELIEILRWTVSSSYQERLDHPGIMPLRKTMLPIAAMKVLWAIEQLEVNRVLVSPYSLKEGGLRM